MKPIYTPIFSKVFDKSFTKLSKPDQKRVLEKIHWLTLNELPDVWLLKLTRYKQADYRFRVGNMRVICDLDQDNKLLLLHSVGYRGGIYE
jgi:mRNA interferase RelE/StbE